MPERRFPTIFRFFAVVQWIFALGILLFWISYFTIGPVQFPDPTKALIYDVFEKTFILPDAVLTILLILAGILLFRQKVEGLFFTLIAAGMLLFLVLMDLSFNTRQGLYNLGFTEAFTEGFINFNCLIWSIIFSYFSIGYLRRNLRA